MIGLEDAPFTYAYADCYKILPAIHDWAVDPVRIKNGTKVPEGVVYSSDKNEQWMSIDDLRKWIHKNFQEVGQKNF